MPPQQPLPLVQYKGYPESTYSLMADRLPVGEAFVFMPIDWFVPAFAPYYPNFPPNMKGKRQRAITLGVTPRGVHLFSFRSGPSGPSLASHTRIPIEQIQAVQVSTRVRVSSRASVIRKFAEEVVLLKFWWRAAETFETRYHGGLATGEALLGAVNDYHQRQEAVRNSELNVLEEVNRLAALVHSGIVTSEESQRIRSAFDQAPRSKQDQTLATLERLHELYRNGVLTQQEFDRKKLELLTWL